MYLIGILCIGGHKSLSPNSQVNIDDHMTTFFGGEVGDLCWELDLAFARPNSQQKSRECFCINNQDPTLMTIDHILTVT